MVAIYFWQKSYYTNSSNCLFLDNIGALFMDYPGYAYLINLTNFNFTSNTVTYNGGAIYIGNGEMVNLINFPFIKNNASQGMGGGIYCGGCVFKNCQQFDFIENFAENSGGAIYIGAS